MRKSFLFVSFFILLLCLIVTPAAAQYIWDPGDVLTDVRTKITVTNTYSTQSFTDCKLDFGDGYSSGTGDISHGDSVDYYHTYSAAGEYTLTFYYTPVGGIPLHATKTITVSDPYATIDTLTASPTSISRGGSFTVSASVSSNIPSSELTYGFFLVKDGIIAEQYIYSDPSATFTINNIGTYNVVMSVVYDGGGIATKALDTSISVSGTATLSADKTVIMPGNAVSFTAGTSAGTVTSWDWDFGDSSTTTTTANTASHTYTTAGTYSVSVTANLASGTDYVTKTNFISVVNPPTVSAVSISPASQTVNTAVTATITYAAGSTAPSGYTAYIRVNDGIATEDYAVSSYTSPFTRSIIYTSAGTKTVTAVGILKSSSDTLTSTTTQSGTVTILPPAPGGLSFTTVPADGEIQKGESVTFIASVTSGGSVTSYKWNYGDGTAVETVTTSQTTHIYSTTGTYTVSVTAVGDGGEITYEKQNAVHVGETYVRLDKSTYYIGTDTAISATYSISPFDSQAVYTMELWKLNDLYEPSAKISSITLNSASGTKSFNIASVTTNTNYNVYIVTGGGYIASAQATVRYSGNTLTANIYSGNQPLTTNTRVALQQNGADIEVLNTTTGTAVFASLTSGQTYTVVASANGYETKSATVTISGDMSVTLDLGGSRDSGGWGQWEPFSCSWQIFDKNGKPVSGASVSLQQIAESFGDIATFNQWNGFSNGNVLLGAPQTLISDTYGRVTFNAFPNVYYQITVTYNGQTSTQYFNAGNVARTYPFTIGATGKTKDLNQLVYAYVDVSQGEGTITVTYTDTATPAITTNIAIKVLNSDGEIINQWSAPTSTTEQTFTISDRYNHDYTVQVTADTSKGQFSKSYSVHFVGPRLNFGIPEALLIWISAFILFAVGGAFTRITVSIGCVAVSLMAWLLYGIGWLWQLESAVSQIGLAVILFFATLVSILFVIAENR